MAEEFQASAAICGDSYWWNMNHNYSTRTIFPLMMGRSTCSVAANNDASGNYSSWQTDFMDLKAPTRSCSSSEEDTVVNFASLPFLDAHNNIKVPQHSESAGASDESILINSTLQMMGFCLSSSPSSDWNHNHSLFSSNGRHDENNFHSVLQEETGIDSSNNSHQIHSSSSAGQVSTIDATSFKPMMNQQEFSRDQQSLGSVTSTTGGIIIPNIGSSGSYGNYPSTLMQGLYEPDPQPQPQNNSLFTNPSMSSYSSSATNYGNTSSCSEMSATWSTVSSLMKPPKQQQQLSGLDFSNNTPFWNASTDALHDIRAAVFSSSSSPSQQLQPQPQYQSPSFDDKPNCPKAPLNNKLKREESPDKGAAASANNKSGSEAAFKRPRIETPSPLPTFKVRKEKLGDRITALQQLVSPFGKTDTASVLHEAIEYIKFLHDQVNVLSTPYTKNNGTPIPHHQEARTSSEGGGGKQDLRSRGLCLVPISSTFPMATETTADFWTPTFGGGPLIGGR